MPAPGCARLGHGTQPEDFRGPSHGCVLVDGAHCATSLDPNRAAGAHSMLRKLQQDRQSLAGDVLDSFKGGLLTSSALHDLHG